MERLSFEPADGVKSRKDHCYELVASLEAGAQIPAHEVMELCNCSREAAFDAMREASRQLEDDGLLSVETRPGYGWEVIDRGKARLRKGERKYEKGMRALGRAATTAKSVNRDMLSQFEKQDRDALVQNLARAAEVRGRKPRPLSEVAREAKRELPRDPRVRELPRKRHEDAS